jgi:hypothetical protein
MGAFASSPRIAQSTAARQSHMCQSFLCRFNPRVAACRNAGCGGFTDYNNEGYQNYEEEEYRNYGRNNPFAMFSLVVFYLVIALSIYAFTCKKSYLTPTNIGIAVVLLLITGGSAMS